MPRRGCARGAKTCMLGAGPPRDGIIRTSPGQECSKDKGALPGARRISVYAARFRSAAGRKTRVCFKPHRLILHLGEKRVSLCSAKRQSARSSMDRASDYGSEGWGFESLRARSGPPRCDPPVGVLHFYLALLRECFFHAHPLVAGPAAYRPGCVGFWAVFRLIGQVVLVFGLSFVATKPKGGGWTRCDLSSWLARSCWFYPGF